MCRNGVSLLVVSFLLFLPAAAQDESQINMVYFVKVKAGMATQFEGALKQHLSWLAQQDETWQWGVWHRVAGDDLAVYAIGSFGHTFEEFDAHSQMAIANRQHWLETVAQYVEEVSGQLSADRPDISSPPESDVPAPLVWVVQTQLKPGTLDQFVDGAKRIHETLEKSDWPYDYMWSQVISGGAVPTISLAVPLKSWADLNQPEQSFYSIMEKAHGRTGTDSLLKMMDSITVSESNYIYAFRTDLSYMPEGQ